MQIKNDQIITINDKDFLPAELGEELVIMDLKSGDYIGLNPIGANIWNIIKSPTTIESLINQLIQYYDVSKEDCEKDVLEFLTKMNEKNIIHIS